MNLQHETWHISRLIEYENNPRKNDHAIDKIAAAIKAFGFRIPVIARSDGTVVDGHLRLKAARLLGMTEIPIVLADDLSDAEIKAFRISVNKMAELADWDEELLRAELQDLQDIEFDMDLLGFDVETLEDLLYVEPERDDSKDDDVPEAPAIPVSKLGDIWLLGEHRLMCGDSTDIEEVNKLMNGKKADMVFTDPPYGKSIVNTKRNGGGGVVKFGKVGDGGVVKFGKVGDGGVVKFGKVGGGGIVDAKTYAEIAGDDNTDTAKAFYQSCFDVGLNNFIIFGGNYFTDFLPPSACWLVWDKKNSGNFADIELAWCSKNKSAKLYSFTWNGMSREGDKKTELITRVHPTQKPVGLFIKIFEDFEFKICFDGFGGSGSTLIACEKTNRICYMMELSSHYVDIICQRWQNYTGHQAILEATGQTFDEIAEAAND